MKKTSLPLWLSILLMLAFLPVFSQKKNPGKPPKDTTKNTPLTNSVNVSGLTDINNLIPQLTPKSPDVTAMEKFGSYPVNLYTGLPTIEIPIFEIKAGSVNIPVKLSYHASGIKVTDVATSVGMGWSLIYGGAVTRQVRGLPDEINAGLLGKTIASDVQAALGAPCYNEDVRFAFEQMASNNVDIERDIFSVNIPSKSNQFILRDETDYQWLMPEASKIIFSKATNPNNSNSYFHIIDETSNNYVFNETEVTTNVGVTTWLLTRIQGKNITDAVSYEYYTEASFSRTHEIYESITINDNPSGTVPSGTLTPNSDYPTPNLVSVNNAVEQRLPKTIYFPNGKIEFVLESTDRLDGFGKAIDKIEIYSYKVSTESYELVKFFDLVHEYKEREDESPVLFLSEVKLMDNANTELGKYEIDYNEYISFPAIQSKAKDYWGYANSSANTSLIPDQSISLYLGGPSSPTTIMIGGANRDIDFASMATWTISRITYPTGGATDFEFNANQYFDGTTNKQVGGLRISRILNFNSFHQTDNLVLYNTKVYRYGENEDGNGHLRTNLSLQYESKQKIFDYQPGTPPSLNYSYDSRRYTSNLTGPLFPNEGSPVTYSMVTEYDEDNSPMVNGKTVYEYREADDGLVTLVNSSKFFVQSKHWNRGQLVRKRVYGNDTKLKYKEENTYQVMDNGTTSDLCGRLVQAQNIYQSARPNNSTCYSPSNDFDPNQIYYFEYGNCKLIRTETYNYDDADDTKYVYKKTETDYNTNTFQVKEVREYNSDGSIDYQKFRYVTDLSNLSGSHTGNALALYQMKENNDISTPVEVVSLHENVGDTEPRVLAGKFTNYQLKTFALKNYILPDNIHLLEIPSSPSVLENSFTPLNVTIGGSITKDSHYSMRLDFGTYNTYGQLLNYQLVGGAPTAFAYNTTILDNVFHSFVTSVTQNSGGTTNLTTTYDSELPLVGIKQLTAPNGLDTYYEYDTFGKLARVRDHQSNLTHNYSYQFGDVSNKSFIRNSRMYKSGVSNGNAENYFYAIVNTTFFDGFGRPIQTLANTQGPDFKDIITSTQSYDLIGRLYEEILPTPAENGFGFFEDETKGLAQVFYSDSEPYTNLQYDESPLNRLKYSYSVGDLWTDGDRKKQFFNEVADSDIRYYTINTSGDITKNGTYPVNLHRIRTVDEQGNTTIEIKDNQDKLIQKQVQNGVDWLTTYYIYDDFGRVAAILQPEVYELDASIAQNTSAWAGGVFFYQYDARGRVIQRHVPNGGFTYSVYDKLDRLVLSQDEYQRTSNLWSFKKYDAFNRNVVSGELSNSSSRSTIQTQFNGHTTLYEEFDDTKPENRYYTDVSFPFSVDSSKAMIVNYYDSYDTWKPSSHDYSVFPSWTSAYEDATGLLTGFLRRNTESRLMMLDTYYYDDKGRVKQTKKQSSQPDVNIEDIKYNFLGDVEEYFRNYYQYTSSIITVRKSYLYDHAGRKIGFSHSLYPTEPSYIEYVYDGIGRLKTKKIQPGRSYEVADIGSDYISRPPTSEESHTEDIAHKAVILEPGFTMDATESNEKTYTASITLLDPIDALQTIDYKYNIKGGINCINCTDENAVSLGNDQNDLFSMKLDYNEVYGNKYYDGNIGRQSWKTPVVSNAQFYNYNYDESSRLIEAHYSGGNSGSDYSVDLVSYDKNGNILQLKRHDIDDLSYTYDGNQLLSVADAGTNAGFNDGNTNGDDYEYWNDGNLKKDKNKGISNIIYNSFLKKVSRVEFTNGDWMNFYYDGAGTLLRRKLSNNDVWTYVDELVIKNGEVYQLNHDEGRATYDAINDHWTYEYDYRDHLGNLRLSLRDSMAAPVSSVYKPPVFTQVHETDPWGMQIGQISFEQNSINNIKFQSQEKINDFGLDINFFKYRINDPLIGRFWQIDPLSEKYVHNSVYAFSENKVTRHIELDGLESIVAFMASSAIEKSKLTKSGVREYDKKVAGGVASLTDANDAAVIVTTFTRNGRAVNLDGSEASTMDKVFAFGGALIPFVAGAVISKAIDKISDAFKGFRRGSGEGMKYILKGNDIDLRGSGIKFNEALDEAFNLTGVDKADFKVTKWGKNELGKSVPVEYRASGGAEISIDFAHSNDGLSPDVPHIGWQTAGKGSKQKLGHIMLDTVPTGRSNNKLDRSQY